MTSLKIVGILSSVREGRSADRVASFIKNEFKTIFSSKNYTFEIVDPLEFDLPILKKALHFYEDQTQAPEELHRLNEIIKTADGYIVLTPEYNRYPPPAIYNLFDHLPPASYKASAVVAYSIGPSGGILAGYALKSFLCEFGCLPVKTVTSIGMVDKEVSDDGISSNDHVTSSLRRQLMDLEWWATACKNMREANRVPN